MTTSPCVRRSTAGWCRGTKYIAENYTDEITGVISDTVERWDADEASQKIELQVGRDLQFIRINGNRCRLDRRAADLHDFDAHLRLSCPVCDVHHEC